MKRLGALLILISIQAFAASPETIANLNSQRLSYCRYYDKDPLCGGTESVQNSNQQNSRRILEDHVLEFVSSLLVSPSYREELQSLNDIYARADDATKTTLQFVALNLNQVWLKKYQNKIDLWLTEAPKETTSRMAGGWVAYSAAFGVAPKLELVPGLQRVIAARLPWSALAVTAVATGSYLGFKANKSKAPDVPPPPFEYLNFADNSSPETDAKAKMLLYEFETKRSLLANAAGAATFFAMGPEATVITKVTATGRFAMLLRTIGEAQQFFGRMLLYSTRITWVSAIATFVITKLVEWDLDQERLMQLSHDFWIADERAPNAAQEFSISLNGIHLMYLAESDKNVENTDNLLKAALDSDLPDDATKNRILEYANTAAYLTEYTLDPSQINLNDFLDSLQWTYEKLDNDIEKLVEFITPLQDRSPLKAEIIQSRIASLREQQRTLREARTRFPRAQLSAKMQELFKRSGGFRAKS